MEQLRDLYTSKGYASLPLSMADLYVLAGNTAIEYASTQDGKQNATGLDPVPAPLTLPIRYGRVDVQKCNDSGYLPLISFDWSQMKTLFVGRFGMNIQEAVAIMGAHSVGRCQYANQGVDGGWTPTQSSFSNKYFQVFGNIKWDNNNQSDVWIDNFPGGPEVIHSLILLYIILYYYILYIANYYYYIYICTGYSFEAGCRVIISNKQYKRRILCQFSHLQSHSQLPLPVGDISSIPGLC